MTVLPLACLLALGGASASAAVINTTDGAITVTPGTVAIGEVGQYVSGGDGLEGIAGSWPTSQGFANAASNIDHYWVQGDPAIIWKFSSAERTVLAVPGIDHGPVPQENLEFILWGSNDLGTWEEGKILAIYADGVDGASGGVGESDDFTSLWGFSKGYQYIKATSGDHLDPHFGSVGEFEIDGVARPGGVPDTGSTCLLMGLGLVTLGALRRK